MAEAIFRRIENKEMLAVQRMINNEVSEAMAYHPKQGAILRHGTIKHLGGYLEGIHSCPAVSGNDCHYYPVVLGSKFDFEAFRQSSVEEQYEALEKLLVEKDTYS